MTICRKYNKSITDTISKEYGTLKQISEDLRKAEFEILNLKITKEKLTQMLSDLKVSDVEKHDNVSYLLLFFIIGIILI